MDYLRLKKHQEKFNILLFGETGSGKSTLINYLTNYFLGGSLQKLRIAIPNKHHPNPTEKWKFSEANLNDSTKSKTEECNEYDFTQDDCCFNFIDTPGLSDTEGINRDDQHLEKIMDAAEKSGTLAAIIIVINGTVARATANLKNTLTRLKGTVPDVLLDNLMVVLTNCTPSSANFDLQQLEPWVVPEANVFYMNNSALSKPKEQWESNERMFRGLRNDWEDSMAEIKNLVKRVKELGNKATNAFKEMREKRNKIRLELHKILNEVKKLQSLHDELGSLQIAEQNATVDMGKYSNFIKHKEVEYTEMVPDVCTNVICSSHSTICCTDTGLSLLEPGKSIKTLLFTVHSYLAECSTCKCSHDKHYTAMEKPEKRTETVEDILHDVKALYDQHSDKKDEIQTKMSDVNKDIALLKKVLDAKEAEIEKCCEQLKKLCSQFNFVNELRGIVDVMKADAQTLTNMDARADADARIVNIEFLANKLSAKK